MPFPRDEERLTSASENGADPKDGHTAGAGFVAQTTGRRPKKSRVVGGPPSHRARFDGAGTTADVVSAPAPSRRLVDAPQVESKPDDGSASQIDALEARVTRLSSVCKAMLQIMSAELEIEIGRLTPMLKMMDAGDTALEDLGRDQTVCPNCESTKPADQKLCLFCSARVPSEDTGR